MTIDSLVERLRAHPEDVEFEDAMAVIDDHYSYTPARFENGQVLNEAGSNEGSCKIFAFANLHSLSKRETLALFGRYFRDDVVKNPGGEDHANIRTFMVGGWDGIRFEAEPLEPKPRES
jgi:hypothetical protein